jgi:hypothetical protein
MGGRCMGFKQLNNKNEKRTRTPDLRGVEGLGSEPGGLVISAPRMRRTGTT